MYALILTVLALRPDHLVNCDVHLSVCPVYVPSVGEPETRELETFVIECVAKIPNLIV